MSTTAVRHSLHHRTVRIASESAATSADKLASSARDSLVAKIADDSVVLQTFAISSEEEGLPQLPSMFGISGQRDNTCTAASERAANSANFYASTIRSLLVAEVADSSVVSQVYANRSEGEGLQHSPSMVGTIEQAKNTQLGSLHTVAATSANSYAPTIRGLQVAEVADNSVVSQVYANCSEEGGLLTAQHSGHQWATEKHAIGLAAHCCCNW